MKRTLLLLPVLCLVLCSGFAQTRITDQPGEAYYREVKQRCMGKMPAEKTLLALVPKMPPVGMDDTLKKYDWYCIGQYMYYDKAYSSYFDAKEFQDELTRSYQLRFFRITADGYMPDFTLERFKGGKPEVFTTSFDKSTAKKYTGIKQLNNKWKITGTIYNESDNSNFISYSDGVLVVDVMMSENPKNLKGFRMVYVPVKKMFEWDFKK